MHLTVRDLRRTCILSSACWAAWVAVSVLFIGLYAAERRNNNPEPPFVNVSIHARTHDSFVDELYWIGAPVEEMRVGEEKNVSFLLRSSSGTTVRNYNTLNDKSQFMQKGIRKGLDMIDVGSFVVNRTTTGLVFGKTTCNVKEECEFTPTNPSNLMYDPLPKIFMYGVPDDRLVKEEVRPILMSFAVSDHALVYVKEDSITLRLEEGYYKLYGGSLGGEIHELSGYHVYGWEHERKNAVLNLQGEFVPVTISTFEVVGTAKFDPAMSFPTIHIEFSVIGNFDISSILPSRNGTDLYSVVIDIDADATLCDHSVTNAFDSAETRDQFWAFFAGSEPINFGIAKTAETIATRTRIIQTILKSPPGEVRVAWRIVHRGLEGSCMKAVSAAFTAFYKVLNAFFSFFWKIVEVVVPVFTDVVVDTTEDVAAAAGGPVAEGAVLSTEAEQDASIDESEEEGFAVVGNRVKSCFANMGKVAASKACNVAYGVGVDILIGEAITNPISEKIGLSEAFLENWFDTEKDAMIAAKQFCVDNNQRAPALPACFPMHSVVTCESGKKEIHEVRIGDRCLDGKMEMSDVYLLGHVDREAETSMTHISVSSGKSISMSDSHYIDTQEGIKSSKNVREGDTVWTRDGKEIVEKVSRRQERGLFNPYTESGTLLVNDISVSVHSEWFLEGVVEEKYIPSAYQLLLSPVIRLFKHSPSFLLRFNETVFEKHKCITDHTFSSFSTSVLKAALKL